MNENLNGGKMKARPSPLKCMTYFLTDLLVTANLEYDASQKSKLDFEDIKIATRPAELENAGKNQVWKLVIAVHQNVGREKNSPYNFSATMTGHFEVQKTYPAENSKKLVEINGCSMLYGALRQILCNAMSNGPYMPIFLPTVCFIEAPESACGNKIAENRQAYNSKHKKAKGAS